MKSSNAPGPMQRAAFNALFSADWLFGRDLMSRLSPRRWERLNDRMASKVTPTKPGKISAVDRRSDLTPQEFKEKYFVPGIPVVLAGAASQWPAVRKWSPDYLGSFCGNDEVPVLDGQNWKVNAPEHAEVVSTSENMLRMSTLMSHIQKGGAWYGAFAELLDKYKALRSDLDLSFVDRFGHTRKRIPWQRHVLAKMYMGGAGTSTSFHCAAVSNLYVQIYGRKKWILIGPEFTPYMYPAASRGLNWQSRVDFRAPDPDNCGLYRFADRYETVLEPGDVLWNPPFVWHGIDNLTESIAVSLWWINVTRGFRNNFLLSLLSMCGRPNPIALQLGLKGTIKPSTSNFAVHLNR